MRYDSGMEIIIGGFVVGLIIAPIVIGVLWVRMVRRGSSRQGALQAQAAAGGPVDPALLAPRNTAELRMWERHFGLPAMRGLTPDQRIAEIVQLRQSAGV